MKDQMNLNKNDFDDEDDFLWAKEDILMRKQELKIIDKEWLFVWMFQKARKKKGLELFQFMSLKDVQKIGTRMKESITK